MLWGSRSSSCAGCESHIVRIQADVYLRNGGSLRTNPKTALLYSSSQVSLRVRHHETVTLTVTSSLESYWTFCLQHTERIKIAVRDASSCPRSAGICLPEERGKCAGGEPDQTAWHRTPATGCLPCPAVDGRRYS
jgi:hypothetical protein